MILVLFAVFISMTINCAVAYRLDNAHTQMLDFDDPYILEQLEALLAALVTATQGRPLIKESAHAEHLRSSRMAANRRPGLLRLRKED